MNYDDDDENISPELSPELDRYIKRYFNRTGIYRMYQLNRPPERSTLLLEFVIRGHVLFHIKLWKRKGIWG